MSRVRASREGDWPSCSSPTAPATGTWYVAPVVGDTVQDMNVVVFRTVWQLGVFLRRVLDGTEYTVTPGQWGDEVRYAVAIERDHRGDPMVIRRFYGRTNVSIEEALAAADKHKGVELPWHEDNWARMSRGDRQRSYLSWQNGVEPAAMAEFRRSEPRVEPTPDDEPRAPRPAREPRVARDPSAITVGSLATAAGVDPKQVRMELRKRKIDKPEAGWEFAGDDPRLDVVKEIIKGLPTI